MMLAIFSYVDRLFRIIRPRKLLYMAVDGVVYTQNLILNHKLIMFRLRVRK